MQKNNSKETVHKKTRNKEILGILIICFSVFLLLSLMTYSEGDWPGSSKTFGEPTENLTGQYGAFISFYIFQYIGYTGYFLAAFLLVAGVIIFLHRGLGQLIIPFIFISVLGVFLPLLGTLTFEIGSDTTIPGSGSSYGGIIGVLMAYGMVTYLGRIGAILVSLAAVLVAVVLSTNLKPSTLLDYALRAVKYIFDSVKSSKSAAEKRKKEKPPKTKKAPPEIAGIDRKTGAYEEETPFLTPVEEEPQEEAVTPPLEPAIRYQTPPERTFPAEESAGEEDLEQGELLTDKEDYSADGDSITMDESVLEEYILPTVELLDKPQQEHLPESREEMLEKSTQLVESLRHFNIEAEVRQITPGPIITRYELTLAPGVKVGRVVNLSDDLQLALKAKGGIRILAPIPGKAAIGIEVPNKNRSLVYFNEVAESEAFQSADLPLVLALGKNTSGEPVVADLAKMPHLLIAGSTGSGKSVCINTIIASILLKAAPDTVRMIMIDPKVVELALYNSIPHLLTPVISNPKQASDALKWAVGEMESRYRQLASLGVRDITQYNTKVAAMAVENGEQDESIEIPKPLPFIVVIIDEFADLMVIASNEVEEYIARLAQMARAIGIHLVLATQRPSSDVITGLIKANFPSRIAFKVMQASNSRIILDQNGADKLLGMGDMLFLQVGKPEPFRLHGAFISSEESTRLADFVSSQFSRGVKTITEEIFVEETEEDDNVLGLRDPNARDTLFFNAARLVVRTNQGSVSLLQRRLKIGYARAARLIDQLELAGIVSHYDGSKAREVLVDDLYIDDLEADDI